MCFKIFLYTLLKLYVFFLRIYTCKTICLCDVQSAVFKILLDRAGFIYSSGIKREYYYIYFAKKKKKKTKISKHLKIDFLHSIRRMKWKIIIQLVALFTAHVVQVLSSFGSLKFTDVGQNHRNILQYNIYVSIIQPYRVSIYNFTPKAPI